MKRISFIGMGEAGSAIVSGWEKRYQIKAFDIKTENTETQQYMLDRYKMLGIEGSSSPCSAVADADIVFSTVTADQAIIAAESAAKYLQQGTFWCDLNSCAPSSKKIAAEIIEGCGGRYVDVAVMSPILPRCNMSPLLISGSHAKEIDPILASLPMAPKWVSDKVGVASSIKMIRSVFVKGLEALTSECMLAAVTAGVEEEVLASIEASHAGIDWNALASHNFERAMVHGKRRAAEMEAVATTLSDLGLPSDMAEATVCWQRRIAALGITPPDDPRSVGVKTMAELLIPRLKMGTK